MLILTQLGFSQSCGIYRIIYVGEIQSESLEISTIKLPRIELLHGYEKFKSEYAFVEINLEKRKFKLELTSHLTSDLYDNPIRYWEMYKNKRKSIPIILSIKNKTLNKIKEIIIEIPWEEVEISKVNEEEFGNFFQINLKEIKIQEK